MYKEVLATEKTGSVPPVAIIGNAFRFPDDHSDGDTFWSALKNKNDFIGKIPPSRWAIRELQNDKISEPGRSYTFSAGVLSDIGEFDAGFFGISPREAAWLDPQQRLLLELSWEAMENAGVVPSSMAGSDCAVYIGIASLDYGTRGLDDLASLSSHYMTGNTLSMAANRISYFFDLHGPSIAVDTACSSSMVAIHHACKSLQNGDATTAIVGGVNLLLHPYPFVGFTKASMLSPDGRSKCFDAAANGYVRSEGGAVVMLKPLDRAIADGNDIQAVILSSGINTDGARKTGITIPSRDGQVELMDKVLERSGLPAHDIDYVEAHGTGTPVGDPVEAAAISAVYGQGRDCALPIGSVKANLGHMEAASGIAGLVKALLVLKNRELPPALHLHTPSPNINFSDLNLELVTESRDLVSKNGKPLVVGVNSFGFGGANAHLLLQEYLSPSSREPVPSNTHFLPLFLSARSDDALRDLAMRYAPRLKNKSTDELYDLAYAAAYGRERMEKRLAFVIDSTEDAGKVLSEYGQGALPDGIIIEQGLQQSGGAAFVYSGNGSQWVGMGRRLIAESSQFFEILNRLDGLISPMTGYSLIEELHADENTARLDDTVVAQPLIFSIQVGCTLLLREYGVQPAAVTGHSVGEIAAAWAAGALDLEQAIRIIVARSRAQGKTRNSGKMAAVGLSETGFGTLLKELGSEIDVTLAGINSPGHITLSGSLEDLELVQTHLKVQGVFFRLLDLDYAFHSRQMEPIKEYLEKSLDGLEPSLTGKTVFVSTVTGEPLCGDDLDAEYWWRNVREPVRFSDAIAKLADLGYRTFIEIGPHAILKHYINECLMAEDIQGRVLPTLRRGADGHDKIIETALRAQLLADDPNLKIFFPKPGRHVTLPNYPWQREHHWHPVTNEKLGAITGRCVHPLLGWCLDDTEMVWENTIDPFVIPWLADHDIGGVVVFPGSAYVEMALAAACEWRGDTRLAVEELDIVTPMVFGGGNMRTVRLALNQRDGGFQIRSRQRLSKEDWAIHAVGRIVDVPEITPVTSIAPMKEVKRQIDRDTHYRLASSLGLKYGPSFQGFSKASINGTTLEAVIDPPESVECDDSYVLHPAIHDICYQSLVDFFQDDVEATVGAAFLPIKVGRIDVYSHAKVSGFRAQLKHRGTRGVVADFELLDEGGELVAKVVGCRFRIAPQLTPQQLSVSEWVTSPVLRPHPKENVTIELPSVKALLDMAREGVTPLEVGRRAWFKESHPLSESLVLSFAYEAFQALARQEHGDLQYIVENATCYTRWLISLLWQQGLLQEQDGQWFLTANTELPSADAIWQTVIHENPICFPQLTMLGRVGSRLPKFLEEETHGRDFLSSLQNTPVFETLWREDPVYSCIRSAVEHALSQLASTWPENRRLRVLEISAGPSDYPHRVLDELSVDRLDYVLALGNDRYIKRQEVEYQECAGITVTRFLSDDLSIEEDGKTPETFDVIILRHVLHKTAIPREALAHIQSRLAFGGALFLAERHPDWSADLLAGLDPAWWHEAEDSGSSSVPISSLLAPEAWVQVLSETGFENIGKFVESAAYGLDEGSYLICAKRPLCKTFDQPDPKVGSWLLLADGASKALVKDLRIRLENSGQRVVVTQRIQENDLADVEHVVHCHGWGSRVEETSSHLVDLLNNVKVLGALIVQPPRLWLVTQGGALSSKLPKNWRSNPAQAAIWGFARVVMNEYPSLNCTLIDLAGEYGALEMVERLENELLHPDGENEIILAPRGRYTPVISEKEKTFSTRADDSSRFRLDFELAGKLNNAKWLPVKGQSVEDGKVEVRTHAAGVNFRDIMYLMGLLPDEAVENGFAGASLGLEFSGIITRVGQGVDGLEVGDAVMGFGSACFASHVVTPAGAVVKMPKNWSFEAAATVPTVYFTVYYALCHLANLQAGERVLIHGGAGGVGIAAIRLARHLGAEIFATAGSDEKRDFVELLGADHVFDSRSFAYSDGILAATDGEGVDVVLNSLAGEAIRHNLHVLKPFGRFLELGKRDFFENTPIGLRFFKDNISYFAVDVDQLFVGRPELTANLFKEITALFQDDVLAPLPFTVFPAERIVDAFYEMMEARHIGKVVISLADARPPIQSRAVEQPVCFDKSSTWLVTGGIGGFGLESARWLAKRGVGNLVLIGRRGMKTPGIDEVIAELAGQGVNVEAFACDVADTKALSQLIGKVQKTMPPIKGVLHAAMVIDDRFIVKLDAQSMDDVITPKLTGAQNLHLLTRDIDLDYFVLYSSITTSIGNPGQANYVAANAAVEGLAQMRHQMGLPATCIGWGPIGNAGYLTRNVEILNSLSQRLGKPPLHVREALDQLDKILLGDDVSQVVANLDWRVLSNILPSASCGRFSTLNLSVGETGGAQNSTDFGFLVANKSAEEITQIVCNVVIQEVAQVLLIKADRIDANCSLHDMGLDSLMAVDLVQGLDQRFGIHLPVMVLNESPTAAWVTSYIVERLMDKTVKVDVSSTEVLAQDLARQHGEEMTELDIQRLSEKAKEGHMLDGSLTI